MTQSGVLDPDAFISEAASAASLLKSMANEHRLMILCRLGGGELSVGALLKGSELSQSALSQHLAVLREEGLVATRRDGQTIFYRIAKPAAHQVIETLSAIYCRELLE